MTQEKEKELLLKDLGARLLYLVHCCVLNLNKTIKEDNDIIYGIVGDNIVTLKCNKNECYMYYQIKPYLRPLSNITEEEKNELYDWGWEYAGNDIITGGSTDASNFYNRYEKNLYDLKWLDDWLNAHRFDYRGLIDKGLALEAPKGMYNIKEK